MKEVIAILLAGVLALGQCINEDPKLGDLEATSTLKPETIPSLDDVLHIFEKMFETMKEVIGEEEEENIGRRDKDTHKKIPDQTRAPDHAALHGNATQSSTGYDGDAGKAIDKNHNPMYSAGSCTHTKLQADPWWRLDLQSIHRVTSVAITNRGDCCPERINGAEIRIGNSMENNGNNNPVCAVVSTIPAGETVTYQCEGMVGRYINIIRPGCFKFLTLCEVEVDATHVPDHLMMDPVIRDSDKFRESQCSVSAPENNVALRGNATQSSTSYDGDAGKAIDNNRNPEYYEGSCTHTKRENDPWWRVDLLKTHRVTSVTITNRGDCCEDRLDGAEIRIGNSLRNNGNENPVCTVISRMQKADTITFECHDMEGRYINVFLPGRHKYLTLCEVEVNGTAVSDDSHPAA